MLAISIHALREEGDGWLRATEVTHNTFLSTPSARRATRPIYSRRMVAAKFLSTPSARRATLRPEIRAENGGHFYPRPPRGGRRLSSRPQPGHLHISIHALREEGDSKAIPSSGQFMHFYPRPPRGGRHHELPKSGKECEGISIHALREEGDSGAASSGGAWFISIHALREEGDAALHVTAWMGHDFYPRPPRGGRPLSNVRLAALVKFLSTPSARRATGNLAGSAARTTISIHALREEGDSKTRKKVGGQIIFLSTPSARRATIAKLQKSKTDKFLSTPSARRATVRVILAPFDNPNFYPRPPRGGRRNARNL